MMECSQQIQLVVRGTWSNRKTANICSITGLNPKADYVLDEDGVLDGQTGIAIELVNKILDCSNATMTDLPYLKGTLDFRLS